VDFVQVSRDLFDRGADLYEARDDKAWSLVDCTSFILMKDEGIKDALSTDHHFT
jgi:hypothetical protein